MSIEQSAKDEMASIIADLKSIRARIAAFVGKHPSTTEAAVKIDSATNALASHPAATPDAPTANTTA